jgi:hypothetical protein
MSKLEVVCTAGMWSLVVVTFLYYRAVAYQEWNQQKKPPFEKHELGAGKNNSGPANN